LVNESFTPRVGIGCILFAVENAEAAYMARLLQGAGSAFAFTGAVYLAACGFNPQSLATAIGVTQVRRDGLWLGR
jgi:hypothetical protein